jgi:2-methylisocitrate lyase-like PEP mutase family enzyme
MATTQEKRETFRALHQSGCFVIPNPSDAGMARYLGSLGFKALATTSGGFAFSQGLPDGAVPRDLMLGHLREIVEATDLPVNADFHSGYGDTPDEVYESVKLCVETGVAGLSIEDSTGDPSTPQYDLDIAVKRVAAARRAIDDSGGDTILVGRAENFFVGNRDLDDTAARIEAYARAGADCLYAPGIRTTEEITAVVEAAGSKPVNVHFAGTKLTVDDYAALGVRRISIGAALAMVGWAAVIRAASALAETGSFEAFAPARDAMGINALFADGN